MYDPGLVSAALLVCPACRSRDDHGLHVQTLEPSPASDELRCACGRRYPIVDGVAVILADPTAVVRDQLAALLETAPTAALAALLADVGPDDAPYARLLEQVSIYVDAHWGDRAEPPPDGPAADLGPPCALASLVARVSARAAHRVEHAVELGCSAGRILAELAAGAERTVGLDLDLATLRRGRRILAGERVSYLRRVIGRHYAAAHVPPGPLPPGAAQAVMICGDALDPPLIHGWFDRVVALNVIDAVASPRQLLTVMDGLCAPGGELLLASPYRWQSAHLEDAERLGGADPARDLVALLEAGIGLSARYRIEDEAELPWVLRRDSRTAIAYRTHYVRARKGT